MKVSLSLMCMDLTKVDQSLEQLNDFTDYYHVDIMDGHYVRNLALSTRFIEWIKPLASKPIDAHLMVSNPEDYVQPLLDVDTDIINLQAERIVGKAFRLINQIKAANKQVGVVLNPEEDMAIMLPYIEKLDYVTVMTVDPGFAGQAFVPEAIQTIKKLADYRDGHGLNYQIQIDGSCNAQTYPLLNAAGADTMILGSSGFFGFSDDLNESIAKTKAYFV